MREVAQSVFDLVSPRMIGFDPRPSRSSVTIAKKGITRPMRFAKRFCLLLFLAATLGLVCSEIPELLTLTDDVSDDFVHDSPATITKCVEIALVDQTRETIRNLLVIPYANPVRLAGPELLRLLSIQRK